MSPLICSLLAFGVFAHAAEIIIDKEMYYLGTPGLTEWAEFEGKTCHGRRLELKFNSRSENAAPCTLFIRQDNVKFPWRVHINGKRVGELLAMDALQVNAFEVPANVLQTGENMLSIVAPVAVDDILAGDIRIDFRSRDKALNRSQLHIRVMEKLPGAAGLGTGLPCRITVCDEHDALMPFVVLNPNANDPAQLLAARTGVVYTRDGVATLGVLPGKYRIYATRGFEYSMALKELAVDAGRSHMVAMQIEREVPTPGLVACDTHIHCMTNHGDATLDERMLTIAGEGIELAVSTEHNHNVDFIAPQTRTGLLEHFTPVLGNEVTTKAGHFNIFPVAPGSAPPDDKLEDWPVLMRAMRGTPGVQVVTLNHPRDLHTNFVPFGPAQFNAVSGEHVRGELEFDAIELVTSAALQSDIQRLYLDWFALLNNGYRMAGIGSSDSHDVTRFILGQGRTYVRCNDAVPGKIDVGEACRSFREGRVSVSMGLLADLRVNTQFAPGDLATGLGESVRVSATVLGPSWVSADKVELFANGIKIQEEEIAPTRALIKARLTWNIARPAQDTHLVVIASGPGVTAPCWAIPRPYQPSSKIWKPRVIASTNPIWLDADGDGKFTAPRALAAQLLAKANSDAVKLIPLLAKYDRATAAQAASLCHAAKVDLKTDAFQGALKNAAEQVRAGFTEFIGSLEQPASKQ